MAIRAYFFICALPLHHPFLFLLYPLPLSILQSYTVPQYGHTGLFCLLCTFLRLWFRIPFSLDYNLIYLPFLYFPLSYVGFSSRTGGSCPLSSRCGASLYVLAPGLRCRGTSWFRSFTFALADAWLGFVLAMFALVLLLCFTKPRTTEWNLSAGGFTCFTLLFRIIMDRSCCGFSTSMLGEFASHRFN